MAVRETLSRHLKMKPRPARIDWKMERARFLSGLRHPQSTDRKRSELDSGKWPIIFDATCKTLALSIVAALLSAMIATTKKEAVDA